MYIKPWMAENDLIYSRILSINHRLFHRAFKEHLCYPFDRLSGII